MEQTDSFMTRTDTYIKTFWVLIIILFGALSVWAQDDFSFKQISTEHGLPHPRVQSVLMDHKGVVWIGTQAGLSRYDHYHLHNYSYNKDAPHTLPSSYIRQIKQDPSNRLWVATSNGLAIYDPINDHFDEQRYGGQKIDAFSLLPDQNGVWIGVRGGLLRYDSTTDSICKVGSNHDLLDIGAVHQIGQLNPTTLVLLSRSNGVSLYSLANATYTKLPKFTQGMSWCFAHAGGGCLWVSDYNNGVWLYDPLKQQTLKHYTSRNSELAGDIVLDILDQNGSVWFATDGQGVSILNRSKDRFSTIKNDPANIGSIPASSFYSLYQDRYGSIWLGSVRDGLFFIRTSQIKTYRSTIFGGHVGLSNKIVTSLYVDKKDELLWIGTDGGGLNCLDTQKGSFQHYESTRDKKIVCITSFNDNELLLSAFNEGLFLFNKTTHQARRFLVGDPKTEHLHFSSGNQAKVITIDEQYTYIIGSHLLGYDHKSKKFKRVVAPNISPFQLQGAAPFAYRDAQIYLVAYNGVLALDHRTQTCSKLIEFPEETIALSAALDLHNNIWIGTDKGLLYYNKTSKTTVAVGEGLFLSVTNLTLDQFGRLWGGGDNFIFCYLIDQKRFVFFGESDGVVPGQSLFTPVFEPIDESIYMGSTKGLIRIGSSISVEQPQKLILELLDISVNGRSIGGVYNTSKADSYVLPYDHMSLEISVLIDEADLFRRKRFLYHVKSTSESQTADPIETYDQTLVLGQLKPADYEIWVSCSMNNGAWSDPVLLVKVTVKTAWWQSYWFISLLIIFVLLLILMVARRIVRSKKREMEAHLLEMEQNSYQDKINYLINVSHELRTPLTLILSPLKQMIQSSSIDPKDQKQLQSAYTHAQYMASVINMVLDVQKMEAVGFNAPEIQSCKINEWAQEIIEGFEVEASSRSIEIITHIDHPERVVLFDPQKCKMVLSNLLMNALQFSPKDSVIDVTITTTTYGMIRVAIADRGIGLDSVDTRYLFTPFYQGNHDRHGSGIGLSYSKILVEQQGGRIGAMSNENGGATFYFELPKFLSEYATKALSEPVDLQRWSADPANYDQQRILDQKKILGGSSVLLVDDDQALLSYLKDSLSDVFDSVVIASNGAQALIQIEKDPVSLIISDVVMPELSGFDLCKSIKQKLETSHIPVILMTSHTQEPFRDIGYKVGADAYLNKPFDLERLLIVCVNVLQNRLLVRNRLKDQLLEPTQITFSSIDEQFMIKLNQTIQNALDDSSLSINWLSQQMCMSRTSLYTKLNHITSLSVNQYIKQFRVNHAAKMLVESDKSISEISDITGFKYQRYFSTIFKEIMGVSPSDYRLKHISKKE